jgi:hypothetical protein
VVTETVEEMVQYGLTEEEAERVGLRAPAEGEGR